MEPTVTIRNKRTGEVRQVPRSLAMGGSQSQPSPQKGGGLLPLLGSIAGGVLGTSLGPAGMIGGSAIGGGLGSAFAGGGGGDIGREALLGGAGGGLGFGIGKIAGRFLGKGAQAAAGAADEAGGGVGGAVGGFGRNMRKSVVNPQVEATPFAAEEEARIAQTVGKRVKGSAEAQRQQSPNAVREIGEEIDAALKANNPKVDRKKLVKMFQSRFNEVAAYDLTDPTFRQATITQLKQVQKLKTAKDVVDYKSRLGKNLSSAFTKREKGTGLTQREEALLAVWQGLDDVIADVAPHIKDLSLTQSAFYKAAPGLQKKSREVARLPIFGTPVPGAARGIQAGTDLLGRGLEGAGGLLGRIPPGIGSQTAGQVGARALFPGAIEEAEAAEPTEITPQTRTPTQQPGIVDALKLMALMDLSKGGKNINEIIALSNFLQPQMGAAAKTQVQQIQSAQSLVDQLEGAFTEGAKTGEIGPYGKGTLSTIAGKVTGGGTSANALLYDNLRKGFTALIARSTGERGVLTDADAQRAMSLIPSVNATASFARKQFNEIRKIFQEAEARIGGEQYSIPFSGLEGF